MRVEGENFVFTKTTEMLEKAKSKKAQKSTQQQRKAQQKGNMQQEA